MNAALPNFNFVFAISDKKKPAGLQVELKLSIKIERRLAFTESSA